MRLLLITGSLSVLVRISASGAKDDGSRDSIEGVEAEIQCERRCAANAITGTRGQEVLNLRG